MPRASRGYFSDFPQIEYQAKIARSIMARPRIASSLLSNPAAIYSYTINNDLRPDQVAHLYYGDSELLWLIFLANNIVDPYYGWPLSQNTFEDFIISKYGTIANAKSTIKHYRYQEKDTKTSEKFTTIEQVSKETFDLDVSRGGSFNTLRNERLDFDANGKKIRNAKTEAEKNAYGYFDRMVVNLKRLLAKIPGGQSRIANYAAALLLLRENDLEQYSDNDLKALLKHEINELKESSHKPWIDLREEVPTNATGAAVVGTGSDKVHWAPAHPTNKRKRNKVVSRCGIYSCNSWRYNDNAGLAKKTSGLRSLCW